MKPNINLKMVKAVITDWRRGFTHVGLRAKYYINSWDEHAITQCESKMTPEEILAKLPNVKEGMSRQEIFEAMGL